MFIDALYGITIAIAIFKGWRKGFIAACFSLLAFIIGLAAALKLSSAVANSLSDHVNPSAKWLPFVSFIIVFLGVTFLVKLGGKMIEKAFAAVMLGWANRLAGAIIHVLLYTIIFSVFLFFAEYLHLVKESTIKSSLCYPHVQPVAHKLIEKVGDIIPWFKNMFSDLQAFFEQFSHKINPK